MANSSNYGVGSKVQFTKELLNVISHPELIDLGVTYTVVKTHPYFVVEDNYGGTQRIPKKYIKPVYIVLIKK